MSGLVKTLCLFYSTKSGRKSQLQLRTLKLYADFVRLAKTTPGLLAKVRNEFRQNADLSLKTDSLTIDFKLRRARNQLDMLKSSRVNSIKTVQFGGNNKS